ncbi:Loader and inhibitor of phage G40P [Thermoanaerobacter sp. YS13]|uniref:replicative helicase loader/inhibitor n=1 Tax=Thermoanaerobacter sp. YS13 TaxID=1511746 RepID=UPI0005740E45|nr:replicative helicase loader/inhibitor [Thermoanaerobacter sp. YS13]KHO62687.1 Loader and inhibitor of phage G40P [Thermoanaerobacter sp. YS13]
MKKTEIVKLLAVINAAFPNMQVTEAMVDLWHELLGDIDFNLAKAAVKKILLESPYPPTIADIRKQAAEIIMPKENKIDPAEAWGEVERAIRLYGSYMEEEALSSMSPAVARVVKYIGWREICLSEEPGVVRGQFLKMYQQLQERERKEALLPPDLKNEIQQIAQQRALALENGARLKLVEGGKKE